MVFWAPSILLAFVQVIVLIWCCPPVTLLYGYLMAIVLFWSQSIHQDTLPGVNIKAVFGCSGRWQVERSLVKMIWCWEEWKKNLRKQNKERLICILSMGQLPWILPCEWWQVQRISYDLFWYLGLIYSVALLEEDYGALMAPLADNTHSPYQKWGLSLFFH